jgi:hypothetical protein
MIQQIKLEYIKKRLREQYQETRAYLDLIESDPKFDNMEAIEAATKPEAQEWVAIDIPYQITGKPVVLNKEDGLKFLELLAKAESSSQTYTKPFMIFPADTINASAFNIKFLSDQVYKLAKLTYLIQGNEEKE